MHVEIAYSLVTVAALLTSGLAYVFEWNDTHVFNPKWPPHAKFHNAQTLLLGSLLGAVSFFLLWGRHDVHAAILTCSLYWIAQLGSLAFPGTALVDPEFRERFRGRPKQPVVAGAFLSLLGIAWVIG
ncbi:MAG TPA: DUF6640 family protein [Tepidisphaeraceae bacterium]|jgi:hypothetical protein|nr:DUF6640 family protein [Tepidisphaeraceae bacterium]